MFRVPKISIKSPDSVIVNAYALVTEIAIRTVNKTRYGVFVSLDFIFYTDSKKINWNNYISSSFFNGRRFLFLLYFNKLINTFIIYSRIMNYFLGRMRIPLI